MSWKCPKCGGTHLQVSIEVWGNLTQDLDGNFQTEIEAQDHEWGGESTMCCSACRYIGDARTFEEKDND